MVEGGYAHIAYISCNIYIYHIYIYIVCTVYTLYTVITKTKIIRKYTYIYIYITLYYSRPGADGIFFQETIHVCD